MTNAEILGSKLYELRKNSGLSQEELAEKLNVSRQAISKWECGESMPDTDNLITISRLYKISLDELVGNSYCESEDNTDSSVEENQKYLSDEEKNELNKTPPRKKRGWAWVLHTFPYPIFITIVFLLWGFIWDGWDIAWTLFITIPLYHSTIECIRAKKLNLFAYPVLVTFIYVFIGMKWSLWHPYWVLFITVPIFYSIANAIDSK